jgi:hypothetical protein
MEYKQFELDVRSAVAVAVEEDPHSIAIQKTIPAVCDRLRTMTGVIQNGQVNHAQALRSLQSQVEQLKSTIDDFVGGAFTFQFTPKSQLDALPPTGAAFGRAAPVPLPVEKLAKAAEKPRYRMSRTIQTIPDLWREWTVGLQGQPSIEKHDELYGSDWRAGPDATAERQFYSRRKTLISEIRRLAAVEDPSQGDPCETVVARLEEERIRAKASLSKVIDSIKHG